MAKAGALQSLSCYPLDDSPIKKRFHLLQTLTLLQWQRWAKVAPLKKVCSLLLAALHLTSFNELPAATVCLPSFLLFGVLSKKKHKKHYTACIVLADWVDDELLLFIEKEEKERVLLTRQISDGGKSYVCVCDVHDQQHSQRTMTPAPLMTTFWPLTATIIR